MLLTFVVVSCLLLSILITPFIKKFAIKIGAVDKPNDRKVHLQLMPRLGGLSIFISFIIGFSIMQPYYPQKNAIIIGSVIIIITGLLDDLFELSAKWKLLGQFAAAAVVIYSGISVTFINLPFDAILQLNWIGIPLTFLWIVGITNAINLIDGLDGLAAGVSAIVLATISIMALFMGYTFVFIVSLILLASTLGFLFYNIYPAKIFMGDTGALFLGYMIAVLSLLGFKNVTLFSLAVPFIILGVPITDTIFAIIRRIIHKKPISAPDKSHLHHCLLRLGYSHRKTVFFIYAISALFSVSAVIFSMTTIWGSLFVILALSFAIGLFAEGIGLIGNSQRPFLDFLKHHLRPANIKK